MPNIKLTIDLAKARKGVDDADDAVLTAQRALEKFDRQARLEDVSPASAEPRQALVAQLDLALSHRATAERKLLNLTDVVVHTIAQEARAARKSHLRWPLAS